MDPYELLPVIACITGAFTAVLLPAVRLYVSSSFTSLQALKVPQSLTCLLVKRSNISQVLVKWTLRIIAGLVKAYDGGVKGGFILYQHTVFHRASLRFFCKLFIKFQ